MKGTPHQCIVNKDTSSHYFMSSRGGGLNYYAKVGDFLALCSKPGARIKTNDAKSKCAVAGNSCSGIASYTTTCVRDNAKTQFSRANICNGDKFTFVITTGAWAYEGSRGTIASASDGRKSDCVVMCHD